MSTRAAPERIFWLDDQPWFLSSLVLDAPVGKPLDLAGLLQKTTFALDSEEGKSTVTSQEFYLHILDGDFPDRLSTYRRSFMEQYLESLRRGEFLQLPYDLAAKDEDVVGCNFKLFYEQCLKERDKRVIVFSASDNVLRQSAELGLPFYSKVHRTPKKVVESLGADPARNFPISNSWEHGTGRELVERYLVR